MSRVELDKHRITRLDGRPFFLIGARHMPEGGTPALLYEAGFNAFRLTAFGTETNQPEPVPEDLSGLYFWSYLFNRADLTQSPRHAPQLRKLVARLRDHPALLCYENYNEPTLHRTRFKTEPEHLAEGTRVIRECDPNHPIWLAHSCSNTVETLQRFNLCAEILGCNPYPVYLSGTRRHVGFLEDGRVLDCPDQSLHAVGRYTQKMMSVAEGRPVWMLVQAMANESWYSPVHTPQFASQGVDASKILYPTFEQMRFMAFDAIVHGATGIALAMHRTPVGGEVWKSITKLVGQLRQLHDALVAPPVLDCAAIEYVDLGHTIWDGVRLLIRRSNGTLFVFAVNTAREPAEIALQLPVAARSPAIVEFEERQLLVSRDRLCDRFEPFEVHVYRIKCRVDQS